MKVFIFDKNLHIKNKKGLQLMGKVLNWDLYFSHCWNQNLIENADVFYAPSLTFNADEFPNKLFIFGPHTGLYPEVIHLVNKIRHANNAIFIQPSQWVVDLVKDVRKMPVLSLPFAVDTEFFYPILPLDKREDILVYFKHRTEEDLSKVTSFLKEKKLKWKEFSYKKKYNQNDYIASLQKAKCVIWIDAHESQGFALQEALACDVPILVWNIRSMADEVGGRGHNKFATTIPYWSEKCGEVFYEANEIPEVWERFQQNLKKHVYSPRNFILDTLSPEVCANKLKTIVETYLPK